MILHILFVGAFFDFPNSRFILLLICLPCVVLYEEESGSWEIRERREGRERRGEDSTRALDMHHLYNQSDGEGTWH